MRYLPLLLCLAACGNSWRTGDIKVDSPSAKGWAVETKIAMPSGAICKYDIRQFGGEVPAWRPAPCAISHAGGLRVTCPDSPTLPTLLSWSCCLPSEWLCERMMRAPVVPVPDGGAGLGPHGIGR